MNALLRQAKSFLAGRINGELVDRIDALKAQLGGRRTDDFGYDPEELKSVVPILEFFYRHYFRVQTFGLEDLPQGRVLFVSNHSGQLPIDATMISAALLLDGQPPRMARSMVERWVPELPFVNVFFSRLGQVLGTPENCITLLDQEFPVLVFPEGVRGINKTIDRKYQLQEFGQGFMRLALQTKTPIVPIAVVGAEEQYPAIYDLKSVAKLLGLPAVPIVPTWFTPMGLMPLPTRYRIYFGRPMMFEGDPHDDEAAIGEKVKQVHTAIDNMLQRGLRERKHIFW